MNAHPSPEEQAGRQRAPESDSEIVERLMRFYSVDSLTALALIQNRHIERLQAQLPRPSLGDVAVNRVREG
jgi:uncharacterized small protein (DUF1192 family)